MWIPHPAPRAPHPASRTPHPASRTPRPALRIPRPAPVQPDPVSGMHCWHQRVTLEKAGVDDRCGDIEVDTEKAHQAYIEWMQRTRPAPGPGGLRRPIWFDRPLRPVAAAYRLDNPSLLVSGSR